MSNSDEAKGDRVKNVIRDTRRNVQYNIYASRKLTREEMLKVIRFFNYDPLNIRQKPGSIVEIQSDL